MKSGDWDYSLFWKEALNQIRHDISEQEFTMWFNNLNYDSSGEASLILQVPSVFYKDQVRQRYQALIEEKLIELSGSPIQVDYIILAPAQSPTVPQSTSAGGKKKPRLRHEPPPLRPMPLMPASENRPPVNTPTCEVTIPSRTSLSARTTPSPPTRP